MAQPQPPPQQQQHYAHPQRSFSPPVNMHSPGAQQQQFSQPPSKRQKLSPSHPNPPSLPQNTHPQPMQHSQSPASYAPSPYTMSPSGSTHASPHFATVQLPANAYNSNTPLAPSPSTSYSTPYGNGNTPAINLPQTQRPTYQNSPFPSPLGHPNHTQPHQQPVQPGNHNGYAMSPQPPQHPGTMGPPLKPADKTRDEIDPMDVLGGTGVNLQEEEQYMFQINNSSFNSQQSGSQSGTVSSGHSFTQFAPGNEGSFYGAGHANTVPEQPNTKTHEEYVKKMAERAWDASAYELAMARGREIQEQFVAGGKMHAKMAQTAEKHGLALKWDERKMGPGESKGMGEFKTPHNFPREIRSHTMTGANVTMTAINGTFLPIDTALIDQAALLSIALKHRLRGLIEESVKLSRGRQTGSHGIIPEEWQDVAVEADGSSSLVAEGTAVRAGWESAVSLPSNPLKRPLSSTTDITPSPHLEDKKKSASKVQIPNEIVGSLRSAATRERDSEEGRLKKRQSRSAGEVATRQGSVAPGAPGLSAPDPEKAPTKKELKKKQESKASEAATHAAANNTTAQFLGGGNSMFGKKKKYSWMTGSTTPGSGASTPGRLTTSGLPAIPGGPVQPPVPERLTSEAARRLGQWREDQPKSAKVQLRDWVAVLEEDGRSKKPLQKAYVGLDTSDPK